MSGLKKLKKQRHALRLAVSNEVKRTEDAIAKCSITVTGLSTAIARLESNKASFMEKSELIMDLLVGDESGDSTENDAEADTESAAAVEFEGDVIGHIVRFEGKIDEMQSKPVADLPGSAVPTVI
jgi:hypothetical protein